MSRKPSLHEDYSREHDVKMGSERTLGLVFAGVFVVLGAWPLVHGAPVRWWAVGVAGVFLVLGLGMPALLRPLNIAWFRFGLLLHRIVNPVIMALLFYFTVTPVALVMRLLGKDLLHVRFDKSAASYWIERSPPGPEPASMRRQF